MMIAKLKAELRKAYRHMQAVQPGYDCGSELSKHISPEYSEACAAVNAKLDELAKVDPCTPATRF
jgi:hypothetical protein